MPRTAKTHFVKLKQFAKEFGDVFSVKTDRVSKNEFLFCKACQTRVVCDQRSQVRQHINTQIHSKSIKTFDKNQKTVVDLLQKNQKTFNEDLCQFLVKNNIPFHRLNSEDFKEFLQKYTQYSVPSPKTIWTNNLSQIYDKTIQSIRNRLKNQYIWIAIDETKDCFGHKVANIVVGSLNADINECKKFILNMEYINSTKSHQIVQSVNTALTVLWPEGMGLVHFP
jgi:hypothetical protein